MLSVVFVSLRCGGYTIASVCVSVCLYLSVSRISLDVLFGFQMTGAPRAASGVVRIDPLHFLARCLNR